MCCREQQVDRFVGHKLQGQGSQQLHRCYSVTHEKFMEHVKSKHPPFSTLSFMWSSLFFSLLINGFLCFYLPFLFPPRMSSPVCRALAVSFIPYLFLFLSFLSCRLPSPFFVFPILPLFSLSCLLSLLTLLHFSLQIPLRDVCFILIILDFVSSSPCFLFWFLPSPFLLLTSPSSHLSYLLSPPYFLYSLPAFLSLSFPQLSPLPVSLASSLLLSPSFLFYELLLFCSLYYLLNSPNVFSSSLPFSLSPYVPSHLVTKAQRSVIAEHLQAQGSRHNTPNALLWDTGTEPDREFTMNNTNNNNMRVLAEADKLIKVSSLYKLFQVIAKWIKVKKLLKS